MPDRPHVEQKLCLLIDDVEVDVVDCQVQGPGAFVGPLIC